MIVVTDLYVKIYQPGNSTASVPHCLKLRKLCSCLFLMFLSGKTEPAPPAPPSRAFQGHLLREMPPWLLHPSLTLIFLSLPFSSLRGSHRAAIQHIKTRWLKMHHGSPPPCSSLRMTYLGVGQPARPVCSHVCLCMCSLFFIPCLLRHKHPLIKSVIFSPIWWHPGSWERGGGSRGQRSLKGASHFWETCERMACAGVCACNQKQRAVC